MTQLNEYKKLTIDDYRYANIPDLYFTINLKSIVDKYFANESVLNEFTGFVDNLFNNGGSVIVTGGENHIDRTSIGILIMRYFRKRYKGCFYINGSELYEYIKKYDRESEIFDRLQFDDIVLIDDVDIKLFDFVFFKGLFKHRTDRKLTTICIFSGDLSSVKISDDYFLLNLDDIK